MNLDEKLDAWQLIQRNEFKQACLKADEDYATTNSVLHLRNKIYALLHLKAYSEVILLTKKIIEIRNGETESDFIYQGIGYWLLDEKLKAVEVWSSATKTKYTDAAGGVGLQVLLYFASVVLKKGELKIAVTKALKKLLKFKTAINWPGPLGSYLLDELTEDDLVSRVSAMDILKERQMCQAYFAIAIKELEKGDQKKYLKRLEGCISFGSLASLEPMYYMAKGEIGM